MSKSSKSRGLGRGLSALMADVTTPVAEDVSGTENAPLAVPIERVSPNPDQPRRDFDDDQMNDLTESIREKGIIQPLIVRPFEAGFQIVAGERRWRAAQRAQLHEVPVLVRELSDAEVLEIALIENIQRADLNPIEEAGSYRQLMDSFGHTQEKLATAMGKSRSHIANLMRLLTLPDDVIDLVRTGVLTGGHARALVTADNPSDLAKTVVKSGMSVRATEALVKKQSAPGKPATPRKSPEKDADTRALEGDLSAALGMKVALAHKPDGESGSLTVKYDTLEQLDTLCRLLSAD